MVLYTKCFLFVSYKPKRKVKLKKKMSFKTEIYLKEKNMFRYKYRY